MDFGDEHAVVYHKVLQVWIFILVEGLGVKAVHMITSKDDRKMKQSYNYHYSSLK